MRACGAHTCFVVIVHAAAFNSIFVVRNLNPPQHCIYLGVLCSALGPGFCGCRNTGIFGCSIRTGGGALCRGHGRGNALHRRPSIIPTFGLSSL
jgi:hypothetical protein